MSNLVQELKAKKLAAMKSGDSATRDSLGLVLGQLDQLDGEITDEKIYAIVRKQIKGCEETREIIFKANPDEWVMRNPPRVENPDLLKLDLEIKLLKSFLPVQWDEAMIKSFVERTVDISTASNDGQAVGLVMKALKVINAPVDGGLVKKVVSSMRAKVNV